MLTVTASIGYEPALRIAAASCGHPTISGHSHPWQPGAARKKRNRTAVWIAPSNLAKCCFVLTLGGQTTNYGQRSLREIPSFFIMAFKVVRGIPRRVAAALITPPVSRKTRRM